jgi:hypothetical protein
VATQDDPLGVILADIYSPPPNVPHYEAGLMPENFGSRFARRDLSALAGFVDTAGHAAAGKTTGGS